MPHTHYVNETQSHCRWDNRLLPILEIEPGDTVVVETADPVAGQITRDSTAAALLNFDPDPVHQINGPIAIHGAEPGDTLIVEILDVRPKDWGWTSIAAGFGLLGEDEAFQEPYLHIWDLSDGERAVFKPGIAVPMEPFCGVMGVAPAEPGALITMPPRRNGGNVDIRQLVRGTTVYLPVLVPGALFSVGDAHAAQGDGEVCGSAIECQATATLRFDLLRDHELPELTFRMSGPMTGSWNRAGWIGTTAHGPDLYRATQQAVRYMIDYLGRSRGLTPQEAYVLCSAAVDLKISEVVDAPNWIVTAALPLGIFQD